MGPGGPGLSSTIPQGGATAMAALLGPRRDALCSKPEKSKRLYQHLRDTIALSAAFRRQPLPKTVESHVQALQIGENSFLLRKRKELC